MKQRILVCFPYGDAPGLRNEAAQFAFGLAAGGSEVIALGPLGPWRHALRLAKITATEITLPGDERKLSRAVEEYQPHIIHAFGAETAHQVLPLTMLVGAGGVVTLGHADLPNLNPTQFRTASAVFVPCEHLREQVMRRLPTVPVVTAGYLLAPAESVPPARHRFLNEELGVDDGAPVVLLADYFRNSEANVALALIDAVPLLAARIPGLQVVIAGKGWRLGELERQAIGVNERLGRRAVLLPGHRDDIPQLLRLATVAVGSGRFAMEAIGAGVALVAVGAAGMVGVYTEESAQVAQFSCCGRHGHLEPVNVRALCSEIVGLFDYPQHREYFATANQNSVLAQAERQARAAQIATYYGQATSSGATARAPQQVTIIAPDDLRELLFALPAISALHDRYPLVSIRVIASRAHGGLLACLPLADLVLARPSGWRNWPNFLRDLRRQRTELCLAFADDLDSTLLAALTRAPHRLGLHQGLGSMLFSDHLHSRFPISPGRSLLLTQMLGISTGAPVMPPVLPAETLTTVESQAATARLAAAEPFILLCPEAREENAWLPDHWEALLRLLVEKLPMRLAVIGDIPASLPAGVIAVDSPPDSLLLAAWLARAALVIAPDTGALHLADLLGTPTIGLFGPTSPDACQLPGAATRRLCHREYPCHPCGDDPCPERHCLRALTPAEVATAVLEMLPAPEPCNPV